MKKAIAALTLALCASAAGADTSEAIEAQAEAMRAVWASKPTQPVGITVPLYERVISFNILQGFVPAFEHVNGDAFLMEFIPDGETVEDWTQMIVVTGNRHGADPQIGHAAQASQTFDTLTGCETGLYFRELGQRKVHDDVSAVIINRSCAVVAANAYAGAKPIGEQNLILHFRDARDTFTLQFSVRRPFDRGKRPFTDPQVIPMLARFGAVKLCAEGIACEGALALP